MNKKLIATLVMSSLVASAFAVNAGAASDKQILKDETGKVHNVEGKLGKVSGATAEERAINALEKVKGDFGFAQAEGSFKVKKTSKDETGTTHTKLDQVINGIKVLGGEMIVHEADGDVLGVTGHFVDVTAGATAASVSEDAAIQAAVASTGFTGELVRPATAELAYNASGALVYNVNVAHMGEAPGNWYIQIDATNGTVVDSLNAIETYTKTTGTGTGVLGDSKSINTSLYTSTYYLEDHTKAMTGAIETYHFNYGTSSQYYMTDTDNVWNTTFQRAGVDAHYYAGKTYDYYKGLGWNSYNGNGASIYSGVHYSSNYNNAFWNGSQMTYGDGDGTTFRALSGSYDVVAHELTHAVTEYTSGLVYSYQSGALNESWSDAQGAVVDSGDWKIGEDVYTPSVSGDALRYMDNPALGDQPAHMNQYVNTSSDNGGVHINSGIPNKAFYNYAVSIGSRSIAGKIWFVAARDYMTSSTNFSGARAATLKAAAALYGSSSTYYTKLATAWSNVGIY